MVWAGVSSLVFNDDVIADRSSQMNSEVFLAKLCSPQRGTGVLRVLERPLLEEQVSLEQLFKTERLAALKAWQGIS